jgi:hypothetical protein
MSHYNTTRNKESLLPLSLAAPLICCPFCLAESFSWRVCLLSLHCTNLVLLVVVLLPGGLPLPLRQCLHLLSCPPFVGCRMASVVMPVALASPPLSSCLCISLHCCTPSDLVGCRVTLPGTLASPPFSLRRHAPFGV